MTFLFSEKAFIQARQHPFFKFSPRLEEEELDEEELFFEDEEEELKEI